LVYRSGSTCRNLKEKKLENSCYENPNENAGDRAEREKEKEKEQKQANHPVGSKDGKRVEKRETFLFQPY
jgi:hypothetical protein